MHAKRLNVLAGAQEVSTSKVRTVLQADERKISVAEKNTKPPRYRTTVKLSTNLYELKIAEDNDIVAYSYCVQCTDYLQRRSGGVRDYQEIDKARKLLSAVEVFIRKTPELTKSDVFCDVAANRIYTLKPIPGSEEDCSFWQQYHVDCDSDANLSIFRNSEEPFELHLKDLKRKVNIATLYDATLESFVNTAANRACVVKKDKYFTLRDTCYQKDGNPMADEKGQVFITGCKSTVERVEGPNGRHWAALAVDVDGNWFHKGQNLLEYCMDSVPFCKEKGLPRDLLAFEWLSKSLRGATVFVAFHRKKDPYSLIALLNVNPSTFRFPHPSIPNRTTTAAHYLTTKHGIDLQYPEGLLAWVAHDTGPKMLNPRPIYYPLELLELAPHQRGWSGGKSITDSDIDRETLVRGMASNYRSQIRKADIGLEMTPHPLEVTAGHMKAPEIVYDQKRITVNAETGEWDLDESVKFVNPAPVSELNWAVLVVPAGNPVRRHELRGQEFANIIWEQAKRRGMSLPEPKFHVVHNGTLEIKRFFATTAVEFFVFVMSASVKYHDYTKILEREYQAITQTVTLENAFIIVQDPNSAESHKSIEHIVMKMNIKLGGLNNDVTFRASKLGESLKPTSLFLGLTLKNCETPMHMKPDRRFGGPTPGVVGYAANMGGHQSEFLGDFNYQYSTGFNVIKPIDKIVRDICMRATEAREGRGPEEVVIYRTLEDYDYSKAMNEEVPYIRQALIDSHIGLSANFIYIAVTIDHNVRFFPKTEDEDRSKKRNLLAGTVIDQTAVSSGLKQFYLSPYSTPVGTTHLPRFTVLADTTGSSLDRVVRMTYDLCFLHQTSTQPLSIPTPLQMAVDYVKRGEVLVKPVIEKDIKEQKITIDTLNSTLKLSNAVNLRDKRITA
ncbi:hypothetical protein QR680_018772 [Steinernema hermaphroditum]|uniref:Piwi domain-containing protein n=1 Tax=Steinernema hermaphroditum TaxID=289476 RepID=A0AA39HK89_9BILA|nr:hypothetical protein QR680_018772 [Steinernema hermaphroditum]